MNWHIELLCAKLAALRAGKIGRLIINVPPRYLKSHLVSVTFPAWCLGHQPSAQILLRQLCAGARRQIGARLPVDHDERLVPSAVPDAASPERQAVSEFETTAQGCRLATSVGGALTRRGADLIIIDDPLKPEEALSQAQRRAAKELFDHTLYSRLNDKRRGGIVLVMHRLHEDDLGGHVVAQEDWELVSLPAVAETDETQLVDTVWGPKRLTRR